MGGANGYHAGLGIIRMLGQTRCVAEGERINYPEESESNRTCHCFRRCFAHTGTGGNKCEFEGLDIPVSHGFLVVRELVSPVIIGVDFLGQHSLH